MNEPTRRMTFPKQPQVSRVTQDARVLGGQDVVSGTRVPAATILEYLRQGHTAAEIHEDYPSLPMDGIKAVEAWARDKFGEDWRFAAEAPIR